VHGPGLNILPQVILWAWERPEDLEFLDPQRFGVAFLSQTLVLEGNAVRVYPRHQPLKLSPQTKLIAVTRIEAQTTRSSRPDLTAGQEEKLVVLILKTLELPNVLAIQVDFDAATSERTFYASLLQRLRERLPQNVPLSITALASFCVGDRWLSGLPVDEAIPMTFRMGADNNKIRTLLAKGNDFREPLCQRSYGFALDEPMNMPLDDSRRIYLFNSAPWTAQDLLAFQERLRQ